MNLIPDSQMRDERVIYEVYNLRITDKEIRFGNSTIFPCDVTDTQIYFGSYHLLANIAMWALLWLIVTFFPEFIFSKLNYSEIGLVLLLFWVYIAFAMYGVLEDAGLYVGTNRGRFCIVRVIIEPAFEINDHWWLMMAHGIYWSFAPGKRWERRQELIKKCVVIQDAIRSAKAAH